MGREKQVQAVFRGLALELAFRDTFEGVAHQLRVREAVGAVVLGDELHERRAIVILLDALALGLGLLLGEGLIRWFAAACNHTLLDGHAARRAATDLLLLTHLLPLDALNTADNFLLLPVAEGLPDFGQPLRDREPVGTDGPDRTGPLTPMTRCLMPKSSPARRRLDASLRFVRRQTQRWRTPGAG